MCESGRVEVCEYACDERWEAAICCGESSQAALLTAFASKYILGLGTFAGGPPV